jgi:putative transposase
MSDPRSIFEFSSVSEPQWVEARRCHAVIARLAKNSRRTKAEVVNAAAELGYSRAQVYVLLDRYLADPRLTSLLPRRRGPTRGSSRLTTEMDCLVDEAIETVYLTKQRPRIMDLVSEIRRRCHGAGRTPPSRKAITARLRLKPCKDIVARREGRKTARDRFAPAIGSLEADWPRSLVQIDHTLVDVIVVDRLTRAPIQRPWLTLAIDVYSRCVVGFHLSLEAPSATSVALCISHAVLPKAQWLAERQVEADWPVYGLFTRLHLDNAKEFRSEALRRGCEQCGMAIDYRPVRTPHYGGHIERLIGTMMGKVHLLPGTTFSNVQAKGEANPEKTASMTIDERERWLAHAVAGVYDRTVHRALGTPPVAAWERGIVGDVTTPGCGEPRSAPDPRRLLIDFLPIERRLVRRDGVSLHSISYWSDILRSWIGEPEKMLVRYDPRDLSRIFLLCSRRSVLRPALSRSATSLDHPVGAAPRDQALARGRPLDRG